MGYSEESLQNRGLVRVSSDFRVIALGLPVPEYPGFPLDPPLRSRFQSRYVAPPSLQSQLQRFATLSSIAPITNIPPILLFFQSIEKLKFAPDSLFGGRKLLPVSASSFVHVSKYMLAFKKTSDYLSLPFLQRVYPFHLFNLDSVQNASLIDIFNSINIKTTHMEGSAPEYSIVDITSNSYSECMISFRNMHSSEIISLPATTGGKISSDVSNLFVAIAPHVSIFTAMMQSHTLGYDICLVGDKGCGKSAIADFFAARLGYMNPTKIFCYKDMTSRDLLQKRR